MFRKAIAIILVNIFILNYGFSFSQDILSLEPLVKEAREKNPDILAAKQRWEASLARVPQAKSPEDPVLGVEFEKIPRGTLKLNKVMPDDRKFSISQMIPFLGRLPLKGKIALIESQMAASEYKNKELEIVNELKNAYYDLFMDYKDIELNQESLAFLENIANIAESKYIVGEVTQEELFKINLEIAKLSNDIVNLKQARSSKQVGINLLLNRDSQSLLGWPQVDEKISFQNSLDSLYRLTLENQPELLMFAYAIERNKHAKDLAKKSFFPDVMAGIVQRGITSGTIGPWDLMLAFSVPLWFWTKQRYEIKEAVANLEVAKAAYEAMKNRALAEIKNLFTKIEIEKTKINLYKASQIPMLESSIQSSLTAYASGGGDIMMLLDSQRMLVETKMSYYKAIVEYNMNLADLEKAVGFELNEVRK